MLTSVLNLIQNQTITRNVIIASGPELILMRTERKRLYKLGHFIAMITFYFGLKKSLQILNIDLGGHHINYLTGELSLSGDAKIYSIYFRSY